MSETPPVIAPAALTPRDLRWITNSSLAPVPWDQAPARFRKLEARGLVRRIVTPDGDMAEATDAGRAVE